MRVLQHADRACPSTAPLTWPALAHTLIDLGRWPDAEKLAAEIEGNATATPEARRVAQVVRDEVPRLRARRPDPEGLYARGLVAKAGGDAAEAQRLFDRALVDLQRVANEGRGTDDAVVLDAPNLFVGGVRASAWAPDSRTFAVAHAEFVSVEDVRTGRERVRLTGHTRGVSGVVFSPQGTMLMSVSEDDGTARIWDVANGRLKRVLDGYGGPIVAASWSPDARYLAIAANDRVLLADGVTGAMDRTLANVGARITSMAWSPGGRFLVTTSRDGRALVWEVLTGRLVSSVGGHSGWRNAAAWSPDGKKVASGGSDHDVRIWEAATGRILRTLGIGGGSVEFSPDGTQVMANNRVYDASSGEALRSYATTSPISWSPDGMKILAGSPPSLAVLDARSLAVEHTFSRHAVPVLHAAWSLDGRVIVSASADGYVRVFGDAAPGLRLLSRTRVDPDWNVEFSSFAVSRDGRTVAAVCADPDGRRSVENLCLWDTAAGAEIRLRPVHGTGIRSVALSPDGAVVAAASDDQVTRLIDTRTLRTLRELEYVCDPHDLLKACPMQILRFSPDGRSLAGGAGALGVLWDVETGAVQRIPRHTDEPFAWSPDGRTLGTARPDHPVFDPRASGPWPDIHAPAGARVTAVAFDPLGETLALGDGDGLVRLLSTLTEEKEIAVLRGGLARRVSTLAFGPLGRLLLVGTQEGSLDFWSVADSRLAAFVRVVHDTDAGYAVAAGHVEIWGQEARAVLLCRAGPESLPFDACAERFESPGLMGRVLRGEPLALDP